MRITLYLHTSKEQTLAAGESAGLTGEALDYFRYAGCEHRIEYEVNPKTGEAWAVALDGRALAEKETT